MPVPAKGPDGLNDKQRGFAHEYIVDHNATQAAKRAGYSEKTAGAQGHELLKKPEIRALIDHLEANILDELGVTAHKLIKEIKGIADSGEKDADRLKALDMLGKRMGWADRLEVKGDITFTLDIPNPNE